jgi:beta-galactosidase
LEIPIENYPPGILVEYRDGFGIAMNYRDSSYTIELPAESEIIIGNKEIPTAGVLVWKTK